MTISVEDKQLTFEQEHHLSVSLKIGGLAGRYALIPLHKNSLPLQDTKDSQQVIIHSCLFLNSRFNRLLPLYAFSKHWCSKIHANDSTDKEVDDTILQDQATCQKAKYEDIPETEKD